ncbi:hypothetical protein NKR19_g445 [Coniochaeta hoffmannii]|uniref:Chitin-binding type-1 domain-containing protein n=1 Tax=Coniochaeta hoffmannii TaxID=91930 RepID=A0AA38SE00_9PEZI|nr:hypothetical protein NKR19_g445 [Coniochaeta hoffmannii]
MFRRTAIILGLLSLTVPAVIAAEPNLDARAQCNANNCYRALQHTTGHFSTRGGALDCSAYLVTTVTPAASTVYSTRSVTDGRVTFVTFITPVTFEETATATVTSTQTDGPAPLNKRAAGTIPDWASTACGPDVTARFSSACSCIGITSTVVTVSAPVLTDYVDISTIVTNTVTLETQTSLTTKTGTTTTTSIVFETTAPVCGLTRACNISGPDNYRAACGEQAGCVCNILYGAGLYGSCAGCISDGNFCWNNGPDSNCCSGYCENNYCRATTV